MGVEVVIKLPRVVFERIKSIGADVESKVIDALLRELELDPEEEVDARVEPAQRFLEEGRALVEKDPVQASEKLYRAAEESVKALAIHFNLEDILRSARDRGRWTVTDLERAIEALSNIIGKHFEEAWDRAWALHVWGFHEGKFDSEAVKRRLPYIARIVEIARETIHK
ncbi:MAG: PaREP1 family protein [Sulfolobales archaeon]